MHFPGARTGAELDEAYAAADLLVLASRAETYGMVVTEALARGVPVLAADVGGVSEALGHGEDGTRPGLLVPPGDPVALGAALRAWLGDAGLRARLRRAARERRGTLRRWTETTSVVAGVLGHEPSSARRGSTCASRPTRRRARRSSPRASHGSCPASGLVVHDLGGGSGSMGRWLAPRLPGPQHWVVHDRDETLLELAVADPPAPAAVTVEARTLRHHAADGDGPRRRGPRRRLGAARPADRATSWPRCSAPARGCPLLLALTVVGRVALTPADPLDAALAAAFDDHQRRGRLLGPDAVAAALDALGGTVVVRPSPWRLGAADAELTAAWLDGWVAAATEQEPALAATAGAYRDRRLEQLAAGELAVVVDHADLLVLP